MNRILLALILCILPGILLGQRVIYGTVSDSTSAERLPSVNVYINNSTIGTTTNVEGSYALVIPSGPMEIVFSFVGYRTYILSTARLKSDSLHFNVKLASRATHLAPIVVKGDADKEWKRLMKRFSDVFLGTKSFAPYCSIPNAAYIDFQTSRLDGIRVLTASSPRPIEIVNDALGYKIYYDLHGFASSSQGDQFTGSVFFDPLKPLDSLQATYWDKNKQKAYAGSVRHFFKSIIRKKAKEEGYSLFLVKGELLEPFQTGSIGIREVKGIYQIQMPRQVQIKYTDVRFLKEVTTSLITFPNGYVEVDDTGSIIDPLSIMLQGYMGELRVSDMLPFDYLPAGSRD